MERIHADRLKTLANYLHNINPTEFDLDSWCYIPSTTANIQERSRQYFQFYGDDRTTDLIPIIKQDINVDCGSTACALGWAATIPEFREQGLQLFVQPHSGSYLPGLVVYTKKEDPDFYETNFYAAMHFFGLSEEESGYLFDPEFYVAEDFDGCRGDLPQTTPADVVERIFELLERNGYED